MYLRSKHKDLPCFYIPPQIFLNLRINAMTSGLISFDKQKGHFFPLCKIFAEAVSIKQIYTYRYIKQCVALDTIDNSCSDI